jgi:predicted O-methyltransferase YrrM
MEPDLAQGSSRRSILAQAAALSPIATETALGPVTLFAMSAAAERAPTSRLVDRASVALGRSRLGRRWIGHLAARRPDLLLKALGYSSAAELEGAQWPASLARFEDVAPIVLSSNAANRGVSSMSVVEVAHLWRLAAESPARTLIEIGRERGGSTLVMAAAMAQDATLYSYDPQSKHGAQGQEFDRQLSNALARYGLDEHVRILEEDSKTATAPSGSYGLVLVDGDPSYAGTRSDFERFCVHLAPGGRALFHDAVAGGPRERELAPLLREIEGDSTFERQPDVGTFADFKRLIT